MGLAISKSIAESHVGQLIVHNNPKHGATFTLELPVSGPPAGSESGDVSSLSDEVVA